MPQAVASHFTAICAVIMKENHLLFVISTEIFASAFSKRLYRFRVHVYTITRLSLSISSPGLRNFRCSSRPTRRVEMVRAPPAAADVDATASAAAAAEASEGDAEEQTAVTSGARRSSCRRRPARKRSDDGVPMYRLRPTHAKSRPETGRFAVDQDDDRRCRPSRYRRIPDATRRQLMTH